MMRRLAAFLVALLVVVAPVSAKVCDAVCAASHQPAAADHSTHRHGGALAERSTDDVSVGSQTMTCEQPQAVVGDSRLNGKTSAAAPAVSSTAPVAAGRRTAIRALDDPHLPLPPARALAPLRI